MRARLVSTTDSVSGVALYQ